MTTSERFLARRGRAWPLIGAARRFARPRSMSCSRLKVPRRYTGGTESLSRPPAKVGEAFEAAIATALASRRCAGRCCRQRRKCAATLAASASGDSECREVAASLISVSAGC